jgi:hypothetical protein
MPRANRHFLPGYVWHITHRCHRKNFLLKFEAGGMYALREGSEAYGSNFAGESEALRFENARFWDESPESTAT